MKNIEDENKFIIKSLFFNNKTNINELNSFFNINYDLLNNIIKCKKIKGYDESVYKEQLLKTSKYCKTV